jgi:hypothetical protein
MKLQATTCVGMIQISQENYKEYMKLQATTCIGMIQISQ